MQGTLQSSLDKLAERTGAPVGRAEAFDWREFIEAVRSGSDRRLFAA